MYVFRLHIRPDSDPKIAFDYCLNENLLGVGWQVDKNITDVIDWQQYTNLSELEYDKVPSAVNYINKWMDNGCLVWTRDINGIYYLAKALSGWKYVDNHKAREADIVNVFEAEIFKVGEIDDVPGKIIACFRASRVIQEICDDNAVSYSKLLWNKLSGKNDYKIENKITSVWQLLDDEQTEDLIFMYLQTRNWIVVPNSRKKDTMSYEFYLMHMTDKVRAIVQVKTGNAIINVDEFSKFADSGTMVYLFQPNDQYIHNKNCSSNIIFISPQELMDFVSQNNELIPANILKWFDFISK